MSLGFLHFDSWYGAIGVNVNIPIFNGFLYPARAKEAALRAQAEQERLRDLKDRIANDVRTSWLNTKTAYSRIAVTQQFVDQTKLAVDLSQTRYNLGLGVDRRVEPGAVAANRSANSICGSEVPIPNCASGTALPDCGAVKAS